MNAKISPKMIANMKYGMDSTCNEFIQGYCYDNHEDLSSNLTTANHSPFMLSSHQSFSSATTASTNTTLPLWNDVIDGDGNRQVVGRCQNCSYKFYIRGGRKSEFCSRDCETCFVLFNKNGNCFKKVKSVEEIRKSIFDFQNEVDRQQPQQILEQSKQLNEQYPLHIPSVFPQVGERTDRPPLTVERIPGLVTIDEQVEEKEKTRWALNPAATLFSFGNKLSTPRRKVKTVAVE